VAFGLRMLGSIAYSLLVQYYYGYGDSFTYYEGGNYLIEIIRADFNNVRYLFASGEEIQHLYSLQEGRIGGVNGYIAADSSVTIMKASAIISVLTFNKYLITSIFFGFFSFAGQWKLFQVFNDINKGKHLRVLAFAVLYTPSIWFWSSGLLKEAICLGALGFIISILYNALVKKRGTLINWILFPIFVYIVYIIKSYIIAILLATIFFTFLFILFLKIKIVLFRVALTILTLLILYFSLSFSNFSDEIADLTEESVMQIESFQKNYQNNRVDENSKAGFEMSNITPTFTGMLLKSPVVVFTCLFRPFIWESRKLIILLSSFESTLLLLITLFLLFKSKVVGFLGLILSDPYIFFCLLISVFFAVIIGFTTFNFGTMTRYKIMLLPFFYFMLVRIYTKVMEKKAPANS
jgi:hypothetical protein